MSSDINCSVKFFQNELEISSKNIILRNYKNRDVFEDFKNNLLKIAIFNKDDTIKDRTCIGHVFFFVLKKVIF